MAEYRIYFLDEKGAIQAREEFLAPNDEDALAIGSVVADACSEGYPAYEIWSMARLVAGPRAAIQIRTLAGLTREQQTRILEIEESIQRSRWPVARSQRLLERTSELRGLLTSSSERRLAAQRG